MKKPDIVSKGANHTAIDIGDLDRVYEYTLIHPKTGAELHRLFVKDHTDATGTEISFQSLPPQTELSYFHSHRKNEETYVILSGEGKFQVDGDCFPIRQGSVVRVATAGVRGMVNTSPEQMIYMVIQSKEASLEEYSADDGERVPAEKLW